MTNHRNYVACTEEEVRDYLETMVRNARKHGILIHSLVGTAPMGDLHFGEVFTDNIRNRADVIGLIDRMGEMCDALDRADAMASRACEAKRNGEA